MKKILRPITYTLGFVTSLAMALSPALAAHMTLPMGRHTLIQAFIAIATLLYSLSMKAPFKSEYLIVGPAIGFNAAWLYGGGDAFLWTFVWAVALLGAGMARAFISPAPQAHSDEKSASNIKA